MRTLLNIAPNFFHAFYKASRQKETTKAILRPFEGGSERKDFTLIIWYSLHLYWDENGIIYCWIDLLTANRWAGGNQLLNQVWFCGKTSSRAGLVTVPVWWFCIFPTFLAVLVFQKPDFKPFIKTAQNRPLWPPLLKEPGKRSTRGCATYSGLQSQCKILRPRFVWMETRATHAQGSIRIYEYWVYI